MLNKAILVAGASIDLRDSDGNTALERLDVEYRNYLMHGGLSDDMIDVLLEAGPISVDATMHGNYPQLADS